MTLSPLIVIIVLSLLTESFFSGSEIAIVSCNKIKIKLLAEKGVGRASLILKLFKKPERLLATTLIGTNISVIVSSFAANELFAVLFGRPYSGFAILLLIPLVLIFGETIPKSISQNNAEAVALMAIYPLTLIMILLFPIISLSGSVAALVLGKKKRGEGSKNPFVTKEELKIILASEKILQEYHETVIVQRILDFTSARVKEHMTPLSKIVSMPSDSRSVDIVKAMTESGFSRIPIFTGRRENIIGIVDARDLLEKEDAAAAIGPKIKKVPSVRETEKIQSLMRSLQKEGCHLALVENAHKQIIGIITIEDILEEIVGEILDEFDAPLKTQFHA